MNSPDVLVVLFEELLGWTQWKAEVARGFVKGIATTILRLIKPTTWINQN